MHANWDIILLTAFQMLRFYSLQLVNFFLPKTNTFHGEQCTDSWSIEESIAKASGKFKNSAIYLKYTFLKKLKKFYDFPRLPELSIINEEQRAICVRVVGFRFMLPNKSRTEEKVFDLDTCAVLFAHLHSGTSWANKLAPVEQPSRLDRTK
ncbi:hypothetical protein T05_15486 [Trichinella murrelli]|uniref:Uncharacterized protein n=1 Tax=Trichinella murrelli TaxID=144512 RepID=A0A0V0TJL1_9BILA|nr:hypothetical protein T05_9551 [Trichinella murrelli]KRX39102.1 hypothetical protein T05_15486 [Trichinella murrelli]